MKLLFCPECWDVQKLVKEERVCQCGKVRGRAITSVDVEINGDSIVLGLDNHGLMANWQRYKEYPYPPNRKDYDMRCWIFGHGYHRIKRIEETK